MHIHYVTLVTRLGVLLIFLQNVVFIIIFSTDKRKHSKSSLQYKMKYSHMPGTKLVSLENFKF